MSHLTTPKILTLQLVVNDERDTVETVEQIAKALDVHIGVPIGPEQYEYVQLKHIEHIKQPQKEVANAH